MKHSFFALRLVVLGLFPILPGPLGAEQVTLELRIRPGSEAVTFPLQHPEISKGQITAVPASLALQLASSGNVPAAGPSPSAQLYLTVTGPAGHPLEGARMEIDEAASVRAGTGHWILESSPGNTESSVGAAWVGAECEIVPHWSIEDILGEIIRRRLASPLPRGVPSLWLPWGSGGTQKLTPRLTVSSPPRLVWTQDRNKIWPAEKTIVPPGSAVVIKSAHPAGFGLSLGGDRRMSPCRVPLAAGPNLVGYPFPEDLRLGTDWGRVGDGLVASASPTLCDRLQIYSGENPPFYGFHESGRWIKILAPNSSSARWDFSSPPLEVIPVGYGFVLFKTKADPSHIFRPPQR